MEGGGGSDRPVALLLNPPLNKIDEMKSKMELRESVYIRTTKILFAFLDCSIGFTSFRYKSLKL